MNNNKTNLEEYSDMKMENPEFRAKYIIARERIHLEMMLEKLKEDIEKEEDKKVLLKDINLINKHILQMAI